jgi:hypothetical protein
MSRKHRTCDGHCLECLFSRTYSLGNGTSTGTRNSILFLETYKMNHWMRIRKANLEQDKAL